jgi:hypothetical protein
MAFSARIVEGLELFGAVSSSTRKRNDYYRVESLLGLVYLLADGEGRIGGCVFWIVRDACSERHKFVAWETRVCCVLVAVLMEEDRFCS